MREREENVYEKTKTYPSFKGTYGNGLYILGNSGATVTLKGGSFISNTSNLSGYYPICDYYGNTITLPADYSFCDASGTMYMPAGESTLHGVLVHGFRSCSALFPVC